MIAVIGGGAVGLACAWRLAQNGAAVTIFERGQIGREASCAAGGMLAPGPEYLLHPLQGGADFFELGLASRDLYPKLAAELLDLTGIDIELCQANSPTQDWRTPGIMMVPDAVWSGETQFWNGRPAVWFERDGQVEPRQLVRALRAACERAGVALRENAAVCEIELGRNCAQALKTQNERIKVEHIVLCAGAWSAFDFLPARARPPVRPVAGQMLQLRGERLLHHIVYGARCYLIPRRDGRLLVGATEEEVGFEKRVTAAGLAQLQNAALELAPVLQGVPVEASWAGLRPVSGDGLPILGGGPIENLSYATGHGRNGILLAPVTAQLLAAHILRGQQLPSAFEIERFGP